jgi:hypothetical protein
MLAVLAQSRGALVSLAVGMIVTVAFAGRRSRVVSVCIVWGVAIGAAWTRLQSAYRVLRIAPDHAPFILGHRVVPTIVVASIAVAITMLVVSLLDERYRLTGSRRHIARIGIWGAVAIVGPALVLHLGLLDSTRNRSAARSDAGRLVVSSDESIGARRDLWAVAWRDVRDHPVVGVGPANFEATIYRYRSRAFARTPRQAHQLTLEVLAERGIVGAALLATVLGAITWSSLRARRRIAGDRQLVLLTGLVGSCSVWIVHVQLDWTWQITAATLPAVLGAGCLLGAARWAEAAPERGERSRGRSRVPIVLTLVVCAAGAGLLVPAIAAERSLRDARRALESAHAHQAATAAARASSWAPHSAEAWLLRARSSRLLNEPELEGQQLERARAVARDTWSIHAEASAYYHRTGQEQLAQEAAADVRRLNPRFSTQRDDRSRTKSGR